MTPRSTTLIREPLALQQQWVPQQIVHRNSEKNQLRAALEPATRGNPSENVLLTGPTGSGKTCLAKFSLQQLEEEAPGVGTAYVDYWEGSGSKHKILRDIVQELGAAPGVHRGTPYDELLEYLHGCDSKAVVVLDEIDQLDSGDLLRELYTASPLSYILIGNNADGLLGPLDDQLRSRIRSGLQIPFGQYSHGTLVAILGRRAEAALRGGSVSEDQLEWIADAAAGDAREAIAILRQAARSAGRDGADRVTDAHIDDNIEAARATLRQKSLERLSYHQRVVYDILCERGWIAPVDLIEEYEKRVDDPRSGRTVRSYLGKLASYNLAESSGRGRSKKYRAIEP